MKKSSLCPTFLLLIFLLPSTTSAQNKDKVETFPRVLAETVVKNCKDLKLGKVILFLKPDYPSVAKAARIGGRVEVTIKIDETGTVTGIEKVSGHNLLQGAAMEAAMKAKFSPTTCNGVAARVIGVIAYNFIPFVFNESYFTPAKIEEFSDVSNDSPFYEAILNLTENYNLAFGYADKNFHANAPLTRGDFAQFLRLTLDMLFQRAKLANKNLRETGLIFAYNPHKLTSVDKIKDLDKKKVPYFDSVKILLEKYDIASIDDDKNFHGNLPLTQNEVIELWTKIFGKEAIPINFEKLGNGDRIFTRGEFALFLQESLHVLTYKVLP